MNLNGGLEHGLTLELGAYVAKIQPGSVAAKEGSIAIGDRIVCVSKFYSPYRKVVSSNTSRVEAHEGFFRLLVKGIFDPYVL